MQNNHDLKAKTIAELEAALAANEAEYDLRKHEKNPADFRNYITTKNLLELSIIDKQTGPAKRRVSDTLAPYLHRIKQSERVGLECTLRDCRSLAAVKALYEQWRGILLFRKIASLPEYELLGKPRKKQISNAA